ncbi:ABC transporter ATP-binding protein [Leifsonia shinshuensis]|uniref:ABC transporter ATP-binding protein n=1 Tax=Leifsonia shinshuensis TaxID=150026 RepID=A0A7G6YAU5_9MICO|nr:ABC transporter ATP-binding protein [Leifsonia shinshuensis]QNE35610.1 ABC transporter ATP-binding protein [Leifsonia shinshuensis]
MSESTDTPILQAVGLGKRYRVRGRRTVVAVDTFDLSLREGKTVALVGESGSGKSTVARLLSQLTLPTKGSVLLRGRRVRIRGSRARRRYVGDVQLLLQDPFASLNPAHTIHYQLARVLRLHGFRGGRAALESELESLLTTVRLLPPQQFLSKFPHELSGGQLQRVAIARTLAADPSVLLLDEPVSMLDVSIRLGILNLLASLKEQRNLASLYITHDIASARYFADEIVVMYRGHVVERGTAESVTQHPAHPYTQLLIESAPDPSRRGDNALISGGTGKGGGAASAGEQTGCPFARRCPFAMARCSAEMPGVSRVDDNGHEVRCWLNSDEQTERPELVASA